MENNTQRDRKIYIIEDDANLWYGLQAKFSAEGFKVQTDTGNGYVLEIINRIKVNPPDFIILDLILPNFDGFNLLGAIKKDKEIKDIPVFVFTSLSDQDGKSRGLNLGADYYFIKDDFSIDGFVGKVGKIIKNKEKIADNRSE